jgi:SSS family solute:Na+ symporter
MEVVVKTLGLAGEVPLAPAFAALALYTYAGGLRAPALIAFFSAAGDVLVARGGATGLSLQPAQMLPYATLALGSAMAAFMYPHTLTGIFDANSADTIRKNAIFLPAFGLIALLGYMAHAAYLRTASNNDVVPALFGPLFPE